MSDTPLLATDFVIPFDRIEPKHVVPGLREALARAEERLAQLGASADTEAPVTYETSLGALDELEEGL